MHFEDLRPIGYFSEPSPRVLAVGWLENGRPFTKGPVSEKLVDKLVDLLRNPWQPAIAMGWHDCDFCRFSRGPRTFELGNRSVTLGISNLIVPAESVVYVAPSLILHYIDAHGYGPPDVFVDAVAACPPMGSLRYRLALKRAAPPGWPAFEPLGDDGAG